MYNINIDRINIIVCHSLNINNCDYLKKIPSN